MATTAKSVVGDGINIPITLFNDLPTTSVPANRYYGTNNDRVHGWHRNLLYDTGTMIMPDKQRVAGIDHHAEYTTNYTSTRADVPARGFTAQVTSTKNVGAVGTQLAAFGMPDQGQTSMVVMGGAVEAWSGNHWTAPRHAVNLSGIEPSFIQQYDDMDGARAFGVDIPFKNRMDGAFGPLLRKGRNGYNRNTVAINISSQPRSPYGEFCGWGGIMAVHPEALDRTLDGPAFGFDFQAVPPDRMEFALKLNGGHYIQAGYEGGESVGFRTIFDGGYGPADICIEFRRRIGTPHVQTFARLHMSDRGPHGDIMAFHNVVPLWHVPTNTTPACLQIRIDGIEYAIPVHRLS